MPSQYPAPSNSSTSSPLFAPSMPPECLERIVYYASQDHRVLATLMQVNSTLFRMATPLLYREPFLFKFGDEFLLDWDTESWTQHLREVRHAKLLLLYLLCTDTVQSMLLPTTSITNATTTSGTGSRQQQQHQGRSSRSSESTTVQKNKYLSIMQGQGQHQRRQGQSSSHVEPQGLGDSCSTPLNTSSPSIASIPALLEPLLKSFLANEDRSTATISVSTSSSARRKSVATIASSKDDDLLSALAPHTVNYLDYVEHLDLDAFLSTSIQALFSPSFSLITPSEPRRASKMPAKSYHTARGNQYSTEKAFVERVLLRSTTQHITTLSISVATFARLQKDFMEPLFDLSPSASPSRGTCSTPPTRNSAGVWTGAPLSQLSRLNISGLHAELKPKVLRAFRWFMRRHVAVYPGVLKAVAFEGVGDTIVNRRRQRNRNVIAAEPVQPGVVHFNNQSSNDGETEATVEVEEEQDQDQGIMHLLPHHHPLHPHHHNHHNHHHHQHHHLQQAHHIGPDPNGVLFMDATGQANDVVHNGHNTEAVAFPAVFHSQYYLLSRNPDESCELDFLGIVQELRGQLEVLDLSRWSWSVITQQALDMIPTNQLSTLRFHPRTRIQSPHGSSFLKCCPLLKVLEIHAFDSEMLNLDDDYASLDSSSFVPKPSSASTAHLISSPASLTSLSLSGSVLNVLPAVHDAIRTMGPSLATIDLAAHLDGFLSVQETHQLMDWSTALSYLNIPHLTTLQLHGHLAMTFDAPLLLELCPTLRHFGLAIKSYTSSSFMMPESARVLPRFMLPSNSRGNCAGPDSKFYLRTLDLEGPWILTEKDIDIIGEQISGLVALNLVGCRFHFSERPAAYEIGSCDEDASSVEMEKDSPVVRLVDKVQGTLRTLRIQRRSLGSKPKRDSADYSALPLTSGAPNPYESHVPPAEPVLEFKRRFPNVKLLIQEKQHEHSFVLAPSAETLRRIHHPPPPARIPTTFSSMLGQPNSSSLLHGLHGHTSAWRRAKNAMPFLKSFQRKKTYTPHGYENHMVRSWGRTRMGWPGSGSGSGSSMGISNFTSRFRG